MKLQFKNRHGGILNVKRAFVFRINFDKEYLFYTTDDFNDDDLVPVIFGELIGTTMIKMEPEEKEFFQKFLIELANDRVDGITNYMPITYQQLDVVVLSGQKTMLPASILNKYTYDFEIVLPEYIKPITDPTPDIKPILEPTTVGEVEHVDKVNFEPKEEVKEEIRTYETGDIPEDVTLEPIDISNMNDEEIITDVLANKVFEQLINSDPVDEIIDTKEAIPLHLNKTEPIYIDKTIFDKVLEDVKDEPLLETIEDGINNPVLKIKEEKEEIKENKKEPKKEKGFLNKIIYALAFIALLTGIIYFSYEWFKENDPSSGIDDFVDSKTRNITCETHVKHEETYRTVSRINSYFLNNFLTEYTETETLMFDTEEEYLAYKELHINDELKIDAGYRESVEFIDANYTIIKKTNIVKNEMSLNEWVTYLGEDTTYKFLLTKYANNGYVCE